MSHIGPQVVLDAPAFIHDTALLHGCIHVGRDASIWPYVVMRSELHDIRIGARSNIQDFVMVHVGNGASTVIGEDCSITHHATLHGCEIGDACLIGINSTIMDGARIGANSIVAGHAIVTEGAEFPPHSVIAGVPARQVATRDCGDANRANADFYQAIARGYALGRERLDPELLAAVRAERAAR
ncbi:MAG TPA: gamma carbonic anhydrase family protein [Pseudomonadales bacterium]|nr:gamma carbonic anhydrase family protein [Pseudomonadales bacterium]